MSFCRFCVVGGGHPLQETRKPLPPEPGAVDFKDRRGSHSPGGSVVVWRSRDPRSFRTRTTLRSLVACSGGSVALSVGQTYLLNGTCPVVMHIGFIVAVDGAEHRSGHFLLYQSYLPLNTRDEVSAADANLPKGVALVHEPPRWPTRTPQTCQQWRVFLIRLHKRSPNSFDGTSSAGRGRSRRHSEGHTSFDGTCPPVATQMGGSPEPRSSRGGTCFSDSRTSQRH